MTQSLQWVHEDFDVEVDSPAGLVGDHHVALIFEAVTDQGFCVGVRVEHRRSTVGLFGPDRDLSRLLVEGSMASTQQSLQVVLLHTVHSDRDVLIDRNGSLSFDVDQGDASDTTLGINGHLRDLCRPTVSTRSHTGSTQGECSRSVSVTVEVHRPRTITRQGDGTGGCQAGRQWDTCSVEDACGDLRGVQRRNAS
ncbi:hypothetical protein D3C86_1145940 [compost metagenome]